MFLGGHAPSELSGTHWRGRGTHITGRTAASATPRFHISFTRLPSFSPFIWAFLRILFPALSSLYLLLGRCDSPPSPNAVTLWERQDTLNLGNARPTFQACPRGSLRPRPQRSSPFSPPPLKCTSVQSSTFPPPTGSLLSCPLGACGPDHGTFSGFAHPSSRPPAGLCFAWFTLCPFCSVLRPHLHLVLT